MNTSLPKTNDAVRESEETYRLLVENARDGIVIVQDETIKFANPATIKLTGRSAPELEDMPFTDLVHPEDRALVPAGRSEDDKDGGASGIYSFRIVDARGKEIWIQLNAVQMVWEGRGAVLYFVRDITSLKTLEAQFLQAQKMEAIGTLAGGVAHDFNNLLTTIIGNAELALEDVGEGYPPWEEIKEIHEAGKKAASLTRELLAFSRKQIIRPVILDINEQIRETEKLLRRLLGENIRLSTALDPVLFKVFADPGQLDHVIMNLAVNAKEAMPTGGELLIETGNMALEAEHFPDFGAKIVPGNYVMLAVSDTGSGMNKEALSHIFEPFFTSKKRGRGTGLGLSTVYGIVKQNKGYIWFYSEPGQGTACKIYLPATERVEDAETAAGTVKAYSGSETILVVEDDRRLRKLACKVLRQKGYKILEADTGEQALRESEGYHGDIDLVITDVVMPGMNGREMVEAILERRPDTKTLFMSGYTENAISHHGALDPEVNFLPKPFTPSILLRKVRELLD